MSSIKDINLAPSGAHKIDWVRKTVRFFAVWRMIFPRKNHLRVFVLPFPFIWKQRLHTFVKSWQQVVPRCILPEVTRSPHRMMWQQHW